MRRYSQRNSLTTVAEINVTPLLDLAFVLLIIFMITTPLLENSSNLIIPSSGTPSSPVTQTQIQSVSLDRNDVIRLNSDVIDPTTLTAKLVELKRANPEVAIVIRADKELAVQKLVTLMDAIQRADISKVGIATKTATAP